MIAGGRLKIEKITFPIKNLPVPFEDFRIVHISDVHIKRFGRREKKVVEAVNDLNPDALFITGDVVSRHVPEEVEKFLWGIKAKYGKWAVLGNREHECCLTGEKVKRCYEKYGVTLLINENDRLYIKESFIGVIGVDDPFTLHDNLIRALDGLPENSPRVLLSHSPGIVNEACERGISLVLSGHTHGGQIALPGIGSLMRPREWSGYVAGKYRKNGTQIYVNRGIGTSTIPLRLFCPSEIALIRLKRQ